MNTTINTLPVPNDTYFRTSEVTPFFDGETLNVYDGRGTRRSWGTPSVRSDVTELSETVIKVNVVGWHKHTFSPVGGNFYFVREGEQWTRRTANHKAVKAVLSN